jgi:hypothetical protein
VTCTTVAPAWTLAPGSSDPVAMRTGPGTKTASARVTEPVTSTPRSSCQASTASAVELPKCSSTTIAPSSV